MPLQDLVGLGQSDAASALLGGEVEFEDLFLYFPRNPVAGVADFGDGDAVFATGADGERAPFLHRLHAIDNDIQDGLFYEIAVDFHRKRSAGEVAIDVNPVLLSVGHGQQRYILKQLSEIGFFELEVSGTREVDQNLNDAIEAVNFAADDVHVATGAWVGLLQLVLQKMQVQNDGIDRVLDLVGNAAREAAAR